MGCDIHAYAEIKEGDSWHMLMYVNDDKNYPEQIYHGRNYDLFGFLAGVRRSMPNSLGQPKGIPVDCSVGYKEITEQWAGDGHSHSYFTVEELLKADYIRELEQVVNAETYKQFKEYCKKKAKNSKINIPDSIFHEAPEDALIITNDEMDDYLNNKSQFLDDNLERLVWTHNKLNRDYNITHNLDSNKLNEEDIPDFHSIVRWRYPLDSSWLDNIQSLVKFAPDGDLTRIRAVFFFDN